MGLVKDLRAYLEWQATAQVVPGQSDWGDDRFYRYLLWRGRKSTQGPLWRRTELDRKAGGRMERQQVQLKAASMVYR